MTRPQAVLLAPVMASFAAGAEVECREHAIKGHGEWRSPPDPLNPSFNTCAEWRVRPTPREWWLCPHCLEGWHCPPAVHQCAGAGSVETAIKVREVLP